ncbi:MAG TPA: hypothetical protein VKE70_35650, partial [Candidatus Solibacter sp.]|nr:hypothetical protein [Candidatus Solibacter sp.]
AHAVFRMILVVAVGTSCTSKSANPPTRWVPIGGDGDDVALKRAMYECERDTRRAFERGDTRGMTFLTGKNADERAFYAGCMEAHGFTRAAD